MSEKRNVPTFRVFIQPYNKESAELSYHGPVVSPDQLEVALSLRDVYTICSKFQSCLIYDRKWHLVNWSFVVEVTKGSRFFSLPWPLRDATQAK
ncbi:hypothetical protein LSG31_16225 [Fodinisporobacter ferrooxydans]|uniref:Uncharacterized protein n=1 Tax=Fodinisporobacter ferrooxydans TaxID=2901836 RepID=A0ABY4CJU5_9BACL|nr:hypothetical protein LSG31_16225 [Alicyclobacillaceae bacterium MYW30-H2]